MSNLIESMIHENVQFSESKKVKKTTDKKKAVEESYGIDYFETEDAIYSSRDGKYRMHLKAWDDIPGFKYHNADISVGDYVTAYMHYEHPNIYKDKKKKKVKESVDGTDEIYVIVNGGLIEDIFTTDSNLDVSVIDLDAEYDKNLYQDVLDRYERNELKNAFVYYQFESLKGKKKKDRR